ncbi:MAG TPA: LLM class flavin-dependent oxidoreductase [Bryobacteraceae bacterium]
MQFGVFDHLDRGDLPLRDYYESRLQLLEAYDRAGFYAYHVAEHHSTPLGMAPSPSVFLAAAAQRTTRLRLATLVYALPLHNPLRMIEEICMLDHLSGGRLEMGFGRGSSPIELEYYGIDPEASARTYSIALDTVLSGLAQKALILQEADGTSREIPMELAPLQQPHPPIWYGVHSTESAERAARAGFNIACNEPASASRTYIDRYRAVRRQLGFTKQEPKIGVTHFIVIADTADKALSSARRAYLRWHQSFHHLFRRHGRTARISGGESDFDELMARGKACAGTPGMVFEFLRTRLTESGANYCINRFAFGDLTSAESLASVRLFKSEIMPQLRNIHELEDAP